MTVESEVLAALATLCRTLLVPHDRAPAPSHAPDLHHLMNRIEHMSDALSAKMATMDGKLDVQAGMLRDAASRDAINANTLASVRAELEALKATAVAAPFDTTALEAQMDSMIAKLDANDAQITALDAATPAQPADPAAPVVTDPAPVVTEQPAVPVDAAPVIPTDAAPETTPVDPDPRTDQTPTTPTA